MLTLHQLETQIYEWAAQLNMTARCWQTNSEGAYVDMIHEACGGADALIVNPGAWTHYSYAIRDALEIFPDPIVEVHLSDIYQPRAVAAHLGDRRRRLAPDHRPRRRRLPRGVRLPGGGTTDEPRTPVAAAGGVAGRARAGRAAGHQPDQRALPDRLQRLQRRRHRTARRQRLPDRLPLPGAGGAAARVHRRAAGKPGPDPLHRRRASAIWRRAPSGSGSRPPHLSVAAHALLAEAAGSRAGGGDRCRGDAAAGQGRRASSP